jgi:hypothetical protein
MSYKAIAKDDLGCDGDISHPLDTCGRSHAAKATTRGEVLEIKVNTVEPPLLREVTKLSAPGGSVLGIEGTIGSTACTHHDDCTLAVCVGDGIGSLGICDGSGPSLKEVRRTTAGELEGHEDDVVACIRTGKRELRGMKST